MKKIIYIIFYALIGLVNFARAQANDSFLEVEIAGYIISLDGSIVFQPCESDSVSMLNSLDTRSFLIHCNSLTGFDCGVLENIGDSLDIKYRRNAFGDQIYSGILTYFYCTIRITLAVFARENVDFTRHLNGQISLYYCDKTFNIDYYAIRQRTYEIKPHSDQVKKRLLRNFKLAGLNVPDWVK